MIYLNHAGTSWPKPAPVVKSAAAIFEKSPQEWPELFSMAHDRIASFFHVEARRLLLTPSCTAALQLAVQDHDWQAGDRVLTSHFEHHAMQRALDNLSGLGVEVTPIPYNANTPMDLDALRAELRRGGVRMLALTAACNVTGRLLPIDEAISLAHQFDALALIDGAQVAGWWDFDLTALEADLFTFAGHKGPQAPWGIGGLYVRPNLPMSCPTAVCDVAEHQARSTMSTMPGYCDAGSVNLAALAGMAAACEWLLAPDRQDRLRKAREIAAAFTESVREMPGVSIVHDVRIDSKLPTVGISVANRDSTELAKQLRGLDVITSGGFQCAPQAHRALGTTEHGVLRFSFGPSNRGKEVAPAIEALAAVLA